MIRGYWVGLSKVVLEVGRHSWDVPFALPLVAWDTAELLEVQRSSQTLRRQARGGVQVPAG